MMSVTMLLLDERNYRLGRTSINPGRSTPPQLPPVPPNYSINRRQARRWFHHQLRLLVVSPNLATWPEVSRVQGLCQVHAAQHGYEGKRLSWGSHSTQKGILCDVIFQFHAERVRGKSNRLVVTDQHQELN